MNKPPRDDLTRHLPRKFGLMLAAWSVLVAASLAWNLHHEADDAISISTAAARANVRKDISFRKWATSHGGVYVTPSEQTPPNPYLYVPDRDVVTTTGKPLTLMNPAYMVREMQANFGDDYGTRSRITSLRPLNPANAPDAWETKALNSFERGEKEFLEVEQIAGKPYLRLMQPFVVETGCLKCHARQGYKLGDIRGGIGTAVPLSPYLAHAQRRSFSQMFSHGAIWLIGLAGFGYTYRRERRQEQERGVAERVLRDSEECLRATFEQAAVGMAHVAPDGHWLRVNQRLCDIVGYTPAELLRCSFQDITHPDDLALDLDYVRQMLSGEIDRYSMEKRYLRQDGSVTWINLTVALVRHADGSPNFFISVIEDINERKALQIELENYRGELERRVEERTTALSRRTSQLEAVNADLESFSYSISHDLRAPLRAIDGFAAILREDYAPSLDAEGRRLFQVVSDNARKMEQLIDDILAFSRAGRREMQVARLDMAALAGEVWRGLEPEWRGRAVELRLADLPAAAGDPIAVRQVWQNLLGNAVKFTRGRVPALIEVGGRVEGTEVWYYVRDNGAGFDPAYTERLFGLFQRLHGMDEFEGTGVGLAIVKRFIAKHGGRVWAEGSPGAGATFWFSLPGIDKGVA